MSSKESEKSKVTSVGQEQTFIAFGAAPEGASAFVSAIWALKEALQWNPSMIAGLAIFGLIVAARAGLPGM